MVEGRRLGGGQVGGQSIKGFAVGAGVAQTMLLQGVQRGGDGNAPRPGLERPLAPVLVEAGEDFDEGVLQGILRLGPVGTVA